MTKKQFIILCEYYKRILEKEDEIAKVLNIFFGSSNSFSCLADQFVEDIINANNDKSRGNLILEDLLHIIYEGYAKIKITDTILHETTECIITSFEELYDMYF